MVEFERMSHIRRHMGRHGRALLIILGLLAGLATVVAGAAVSFQMKERTLRISKEKEVLLLKAANEDLERQVSEAVKAQEELKGELAKSEAQLDQAARSLAQELQVKDALAKSVDERQREIDRIGRDLQQLKSERLALTDEVARLKAHQDELELQLSEVQHAKTELEAAMHTSGTQPTTELEKVVVTSPTSMSASSGMSGSSVSAAQGQVIVVNREYDFVVVNLGKNQGLQVGQEFQVIRDNQVLGHVKVEKVYDELSAAALLPDSNKDEIREGDSVKAI